MSKYIRLEEAIKMVDEKPDMTPDEKSGVIARLLAVPPADVLPVKRGKWNLNKDGSGTCSECGRRQNSCWDLDDWDNFCHFCGADMREYPKEEHT